MESFSKPNADKKLQEMSMQDCIDECTECSAACLRMINHCLNKGGKHASPEHITLLQNCSEFCGLAANFMIGNSDFAYDVCKLCSEICTSCAEGCDRLGDDLMILECAETCRSCAEACKNMSTIS